MINYLLEYNEAINYFPPKKYMLNILVLKASNHEINLFTLIKIKKTRRIRRKRTVEVSEDVLNIYVAHYCKPFCLVSLLKWKKSKLSIFFSKIF